MSVFIILTKCVNSNLSAIDHINSVVCRIYYVLRNLRMSLDYTPLETRLKLVKQLIIPIISYFDSIYCKLDSISLHKLLVAFNHATRYVYHLSRFEHISGWSKLILGCDLATYLKLRNLSFLYRLMKYKTPHYLYEKLRFGQSNRSRILIVPKHNCVVSERYFFINSVRLWNTLPTTIKLITNKSIFETELKKHFCQN